MSDLQREKFEKWCENDASHLFVNYLPKLGCYSNSDTQTAWESWCAAIGSVIVELPEWDDFDSRAVIYECAKSIENAGVKHDLRD